MLLAIETATDVCAVAVADDAGRVVAEAAVYRPRAHAAHLAPLVRDVLARAEIAPSGLGAVAVSAGPGSFTGLRIGVSTAKGLCLATGAALVAVPSLEALALAARPHLAAGDAVAVAFGSRQGEVYAAAYAATADGLAPLREPAALTLGELPGWLPEGPLALAGEAADRLAEAAGGRALVRLGVRPSAAAVAALGHARLAAGHVEDVAAFEPAYLKAFVAKPGRPAFG